MSVAVVTPAYTNDRNEWRCLRESAEVLGVALTVHGQGQNYPCMGALTELIPLIGRLEQDYVLVTDAYDTMLCRWDADEIMRLVDAAPGYLLLSCERECYPPGPWGTAYGEPNSLWWYANGGQYVGTRESIVGLWEAMRSGKWPAEQGGSSQEMIHRMIADGVPFGRDTSCHVFQSMSGGNAQHATCTGKGTVINTITGTHPMLLHWNGRTPGMSEMFEQWRGNR